MNKLNQYLSYIALACTFFLIYLVVQYLFPEYFNYHIIGIVHQLFIIPVLVISFFTFIYSTVFMFRTKGNEKIRPVFVISFINITILVLLGAFAE